MATDDKDRVPAPSSSQSHDPRVCYPITRKVPPCKGFVKLALAFGLTPDLLNALLLDDIVAQQPDTMIVSDRSALTELLLQSPNARRAGKEIILERRPNLRLLPSPPQVSQNA